jgi:2-keto-4-pentenoate hydratase/2-oxohepta-3-ene-1,7-dioic acid hydratase in catechol pathway
VQDQRREKGLPWEKAKAFDCSAVLCPEFVPVASFADLQNVNFRLDINGQTVQSGNTAQMIFPIDELIAQISRYFTLKIGDLIYTGTPAGVGPVKIGDRLEGYLEDKKMFDFLVK